MLDLIMGGLSAGGNLLNSVFGGTTGGETHRRIVDPYTKQMVSQSEAALQQARSNRRGEVAGVMRRTNNIASTAASKTFGASQAQGLGPGNAAAVESYASAVAQDQGEAQGIAQDNSNVYAAEQQHSQTLGRASDQSMYRFQDDTSPNMASRVGNFLGNASASFGAGVNNGMTIGDMFDRQSFDEQGLKQVFGMKRKYFPQTGGY